MACRVVHLASPTPPHLGACYSSPCCGQATGHADPRPDPPRPAAVYTAACGIASIGSPFGYTYLLPYHCGVSIWSFVDLPFRERPPHIRYSAQVKNMSMGPEDRRAPHSPHSGRGG